MTFLQTTNSNPGYKQSSTLGHPDHNDATFGQNLTPLRISYLCSPPFSGLYQHAVLNFSQYPYGGLPAMTNIGSAHSPGEYIGDRIDKSSWLQEPEIINAFNQFSIDMKNIEKDINNRNADPKLRNGCSHEVSPSDMLIPNLGCDVTGQGVPISAMA
ncbi:hypothetical protein KIW84_072946 [Lathyrus oleraceus]|uniref:Lipoxygenase domain-containing protein n=1 Tax=Pisum sativum TaxID=3888 RepID=A0A9D4VPX6_PEA|nr:hypothetical protein KIW84_072946 [Pisum sativum]